MTTRERLKRQGFLLTDPGGAWRVWDHTVRSQGQGGVGREGTDLGSCLYGGEGWGAEGFTGILHL